MPGKAASGPDPKVVFYTDPERRHVMPKKEYLMPVYNEAAGRFETVRLSEEQYNAVRRGGWHIEYQDERFFNKEIQFSVLAYGNSRNYGESDDSMQGGFSYENFREFITYDEDPQMIVDRLATSEIIANALVELDEKDLSLILELIVFKKTEREYADEIGEYQMKIHRRKKSILEKLRKKVEAKINF